MAEIVALKQMMSGYLQGQTAATGRPLNVLRQVPQTASAAAPGITPVAAIDGAIDIDGTVEKSPVKTDCPLLDYLCELFGLSSLDRQLLLLCVAMELDEELPRLCAAIGQSPMPTLSLAQMLFDGDHSALAPTAPHDAMRSYWPSPQLLVPCCSVSK